MKILRAGFVVAVTIGALATFGDLTAAGRPSQAAGSAHAVTAAQFERWKTELSNWGRWGKDDQIGALNLITPAKRRQAFALVKEGFPVSLAADVDTEKAIDNPNPYEHTMLGLGTDRIGVAFHGIAHTHLDSLAHINYDGKFYNGYSPQQDVVMKDVGHAKNSIYNLKNGIFTRGILLDIPRLKGVPYLEPGTRIFPADLEAWEKKTGVKAGAGDALLLRWGRWARRAKLGAWPIDEGAAGFDNSVIPWLKKRDIALLGWETPGYVPQPAGDLPRLAVHDFALTILGVHLLDRADFDALSEAAAARNRWEFMLTIAPLPIPNGTGSPVNPIASF